MTISIATQAMITRLVDTVEGGLLEDFLFSNKEEFEEIRLQLLKEINDRLHSELYHELYHSQFDEDVN